MTHVPGKRPVDSDLGRRNISLSNTSLTLALLILGARTAYIVFGGMGRIVTFLPDDSFYYFHAAQNFARLGIWTFDGGISRTTGFHILHAYALAASTKVIGWQSHGIVIFAIMITTTCAAAAMLLISRISRESFGDRAAATLLLPFLSYGFLTGASSGMEWGWVVLFAALIFAEISHCDPCPPGVIREAYRVGLGLLLVLSRSDAGALAFAVFVGTGIVSVVRPNASAIRKAMLVFAGAVIAILLTFTHNYAFSGHIVSNSAQVKLLWGQRAGYSLRAFYWLTLVSVGLPRYVIGFRSLVLVAPFAIFGFAALRLRARHSWKVFAETSPETLNLISASVCAMAVFAILDGFNPIGTQVWYSCEILLPICILLAAFVEAVEHFGSRVVHTLSLAYFSVLALCAAADAFTPSWRYQTYMKLAGEYAAEELPRERIGCWNCGIIGFFGNGRIVDLDGLMNDQAFPYIVTNTLGDYIRREKIAYILDFSGTVEEPSSQELGGYDEDSFREELHPVKQLSPPQPSYGGWAMTLYRLEY